MENLFAAWREFSRGKMKKADVLEFKANLEDNIFELHRELKNKTYEHSHYTAFSVFDPKPRRIHKATVKDRVLHHAVFRILYPIFDKSFIFDSYSCRMEKGTHQAVKQLESFCRKLSWNNHRNIFALKCDIRKFFDSIDQNILLELIKRKIEDKDAIWLVEKIISSFEKGLPLGNVTSQLFANIYLNELDQFIKHELKMRADNLPGQPSFSAYAENASHWKENGAEGQSKKKERYYLRYCDDFIILSDNENYLRELVPTIDNFMQKNLKLKLHPDKIVIRKYRQGIDFLGYVVLPYHRILRTKTKKRIMKKLRERYNDKQSEIITKESFNQSLQSYLGILKHCEGHKIRREITALVSDKNPI